MSVGVGGRRDLRHAAREQSRERFNREVNVSSVHLQTPIVKMCSLANTVRSRNEILDRIHEQDADGLVG